MLVFYSFLLTVGFILMLPIFLLRREKYMAGFRQRLGYLPEFKHDGRSVLWLHCVSVGEANAARPLAEKLKKQFPDLRLIVSTTTKTGQNLAREIFKNTAETIFYFPFDWKFSVRRALKNFKPDIVLLMETELWFNFINEANLSGAFISIVNGRLSEKSFKNYSRIPRTMRRTLRRVDFALMQTNSDANRLMRLGIRQTKVKVTGNIKFDQTPEKSDLTEVFRRRFGISPDAPLIVAASTHAPEERWILDAFARIYKNFGDRLPRLLIAPRHPERFAEVGALIDETAFSCVRRTSAPNLGDELADIILLDSIGELRAVYPLAELVFVGGSLIPHGGQSVLEPALLGKPIVTGFHTANFKAVVAEFLDKNALVQLPETDEKTAPEKLAEAFSKILKDEKTRLKLGTNALAVMEKNRGATLRTIEILTPFLEVHKLK